MDSIPGTGSSQLDEGPDFRARLTNPNILAAGLRGISNGKREQHVHVEIIPKSCIRFITTDAAKSLQAIATIKDKLFEEWYLKHYDADIVFRINVAILLDCLSMGTGSTSAGLSLTYSESTGTLTLQLMEPESTTECVIRTLAEDVDDDFMPDFSGAFEASDKFNKLIIQSAPLRDGFSDLFDLPGASQITVAMSPEAPELRLSAEGELGVCFVDFSRTSFSNCALEHSLLFSYKITLIERALKPLAEADKTFVRINGDGILSLQHLIRHSEDRRTYVDFFILATEDGEGLAGGPDEPDVLVQPDD